MKKVFYLLYNQSKAYANFYEGSEI